MRILLPVSVMASVLTVAPTLALEYTCPSDPGFCYLDVANDGCFDAGTDTGPIDAMLEAGSFPDPSPPGFELPADPGSIICPPSVGQLAPSGSVDWRTGVGGHVRLFEAEVLRPGDPGFSGEEVTIVSGGDLQLGEEIAKRSGSVFLLASDDVVIHGSIRGGQFVVIDSAGGSVWVGPKVRLQAKVGHVRLESGGDLTMEDKVLIQESTSGTGSPQISAGGALTMANVKVKTKRRVQMAAASIRGLGKTTVRSTGGGAVPPTCEMDFSSDSAGSIWFDRLVLKGVGQACFSGGSVRIGDGVRRSKVTVKPALNGPHEVRVSVDGSVDLDRLSIVAPSVDITTSGTEVVVTDGLLKATGGTPGTTTLTTGIGSTCDLTGTKLKNMTLSEDCGVLIGP